MEINDTEEFEYEPTWAEKLNTLEKGKSLPVDIASSVYTAIRDHFSYKGCIKKFTIQTHPKTLKKRVFRTN